MCHLLQGTLFLLRFLSSYYLYISSTYWNPFQIYYYRVNLSYSEVQDRVMVCIQLNVFLFFYLRSNKVSISFMFSYLFILNILNSYWHQALKRHYFEIRFFIFISHKANEYKVSSISRKFQEILVSYRHWTPACRPSFFLRSGKCLSISLCACSTVNEQLWMRDDRCEHVPHP